ncbi:uncharacterized protein M6B38_382575 [Iris pallida]|uniref:cAMP-regulated phosphoprotein 19-related protein n=1 Tax=Iris pallida TaxID=29817 RepID=A0AAX6FL71_IRIPA|nr:uncharacterized protein M6B38_413270 [Iris pallida]KAJ6821457.1 uncharacterized protein M6B38_392355 [Iris pallida]KAJ6824402.1 uncharacterized protein M6B38_382575 [Iris pallida]
MSDVKDTDVDKQVSTEEIFDEKGDVNLTEQLEIVNQDDANSMPSAQEEEAVLKKKYGGILPKKPPLISKDHERAFFDSADWALGKQGAQKPKGPLEALRPKLQPTPQQQARSRRSAYASADSEDGGNAVPEDANNHQ